MDPSHAFQHEGITFSYRETGSGTPFFFQHGLGGDANQTFNLFRPPPGIRLLTLDCRAHGQTPVGPPEKISLATFTNDLLALMDFLKIEKAIVGGVSMGAAMALSLAIAHPDRVLGLVLDRPAWLDGPRRDNIAAPCATTSGRRPSWGFEGYHFSSLLDASGFPEPNRWTCSWPPSRKAGTRQSLPLPRAARGQRAARTAAPESPTCVNT